MPSQNKLKRHESKILEMLQAGISKTEILKWLTKQKCTVSLTYLNEFLLNKGYSVEDEPIHLSTASQGKNFDFTKHIESFDSISYTDFLQKALRFLVDRQLQIVAKEQEDYFLGLDESQSSASLFKLKLLLTEFYKICPLNIIANQQEAMKVIQRMGYTVSFEGDIINVESEPDTGTIEEN